MIWTQPQPDGKGGFELLEVSHPRVNGCSGWFKMSAAEGAGLVDPSGTGETGHVAQANAEHRTDWVLWLNLTLGFGAVACTVERVMRMRYHWLLDSGTGT